MTHLIDLDDQRAHDPLVVGAKAARLANARRAGLPSLPGVVVPVDVGRPALHAGSVSLAQGGSGRARLAAMEVEVDAQLLEQLVSATAVLGHPVVVRSSSPVEGDAVWAGTFSSFDGIQVEDLRTALRGVWASAFTIHAIERCEAIGVEPSDLELAVLVQPEVIPECGGSARVVGDGTVAVHAIAGAPKDLMEGWEVGVRARVSIDGRILDGDAAAALGDEPVLAAANLARRTREMLGDDLIEWAWADDEIFLLQSSTLPPAPLSVADDVNVSVLERPDVVAAARRFHRFPGPLGEQLVLPWAFGSSEPPASEDPWSDDPETDLRRAIEIATNLTKEAWQQRTGARELAATFTELRGPEPLVALENLMSARAVDRVLASELVRLLEGVAVSLTARGRIRTPRRLWRYSVNDALRIASGESTTVDPLRHGPDRWEPLLHAAVRANGRTASGLPVVPGIGAGRLLVVRDPHDPPPIEDRDVIVAERPLPAFAPLLWRASALVTTTGNPAAHLMEVATSLAVPTVLGVDLSELGGMETLMAQDLIAAVDGESGVVAVLPT